MQFEFNRRCQVLYSVIVRFENDAAVQLKERFVNPQLVPDYDGQDFSRGTTFDYLMKATPVTDMEHLISAVAADAGAAQLLRVPTFRQGLSACSCAAAPGAGPRSRPSTT